MPFLQQHFYHKPVCPAAIVLLLLFMWGCSSTKHVPDGKYLLDKVTIEVEEDSLTGREAVKVKELTPYLRQVPNHKVLGFLRLQLATYSLSGRDSTKWYNRWLRRIGQPPVIYDPAQTTASERQLQLAMINRGYMDATVSVDTIPNPQKKRMEVRYHISPGAGHTIGAVNLEMPDPVISAIVLSDSAGIMPQSGGLLNRDDLNNTRAAIAQRLNDAGYYGFTKEYVTFRADTVAGSNVIDLTLTVRPPRENATDSTPASVHPRYTVRRVWFVTNYFPGMSVEQMHRAAVDTVTHKGISVLYGPDRYLKASTLEEKCFIAPGQLYSQSRIDRTYASLMQLGILRSVSILPVPVDHGGDIDIYILLSRNRKQSVTFEIEGTNSEGDLGFGGSVTYQHRDLGHRSELFTAKVRANYESISGDLDGFINDRYTEYAAEVGVTFPKFVFPFLSSDYKRRIRASSEVSTTFNYQERPEYTRVIAGASWKFRWNNRLNTTRRTLDMVDIQYVYLPKSTNDFINNIAPDNPLLRYSYEDHLIMRAGYTYNHTNRRIASSAPGARYTLQPRVFNARLSAEIAGNLLYCISNLIGQKKEDKVYRVLGVPYSQYVKGEADYSVAFNLNPRHSIALHAAGGIAIPYGNSSVVPFEKRFYAGGANGVRGWSVRTLGPGSFDSRNSVSSFMDQCGDISMVLSAEYRVKLFWVIEAGLFVDAGNIWTIRDYPNQPGGLFRFDRFYKEIAMSYGAGLRLDFTYFLFRLDLGMKGYNPARNQEPWPLVHPRWGRDATVHFSVGYPF